MGEPGILIPTEDDDIGDFVVGGGNDDIPDEDVEPEFYPLHWRVIRHLWWKKIFQWVIMLVVMW